MAQYDFGTIDPNTKSGTALASDLNSYRNAVNSMHSGSAAPSYITAGMMWVDTTSADYEVKLYDGAQSITVAIIDATNNVARVAVDPAETSYITSTTSAQIRHVIASTNIFTTRSTGIQFNLASPTITDNNSNEWLSFTTTASAVNHIDIANSATGGAVALSAAGADTNISIALTPKGAGVIQVNGGATVSGGVRTNAILDASGGTTATFNSIPLRPGVLDPENRIINGAFDFWQRGTSFTANAYGADRWSQDLSGGTVTMSRQAFTLGDTLGSNSPTYFLRQTVSGQSTSSQYALITQPVEGVRSYAGQTITVLGWARRSSGSGNMAVEVGQVFGTGGSPSAAVNVTGQTVTLTSSFAPFALTFNVPSITGKTLGTTNNDYFRVLFWTSAGSDYNARSNSLGIQTIGVDLWGIHIKQGTHTTSAVDLYRQPELGPELARCQRYYYQDAGVGVDAHAVSAAIATGTYYLPVTMRVVPTILQTGSVLQSGGTAQTTFTTNATPYSDAKKQLFALTSNATGRTQLYRPVQFDAEL